MESETQMHKLPGNAGSWSNPRGTRLWLLERGGACGGLYQVNIWQVAIYGTQEWGTQHGALKDLCPRSSLISSQPSIYTHSPFPIWSLYKERWTTCVGRAEENAVGPAQQPKVGVAACPQAFLQVVAGIFWEPVGEVTFQAELGLGLCRNSPWGTGLC